MTHAYLLSTQAVALTMHTEFTQEPGTKLVPRHRP